MTPEERIEALEKRVEELEFENRFLTRRIDSDREYRSMMGDIKYHSKMHKIHMKMGIPYKWPEVKFEI